LYQIKEEHDSSADEMPSLSEKQFIAIKQEAQEDCKVSCGSESKVDSK
jgi:hypothetical protein